METTQLVVLLVGGYPLVGLLRSKRQMLIEVERQLLGNLLRGYLLLPDVHHLGQYLVRRHQHGGENFALSHAFFVQSNREIVKFEL